MELRRALFWYKELANLVVMVASFSDVSATFWSVKPWECVIAKVIAAMYMP